MFPLTIEQFAQRTGMVIVRPVVQTPWFPKVGCLLVNPLFLLYLRGETTFPGGDDEDDDDFSFEEEEVDEVPRISYESMLAPTFAPIHWFTLTDVIREQDDQWDPDWSPAFAESIEDQLEEVERRLEHIRKMFSTEYFLRFSTRVRSGRLAMQTPDRR